MIHKNARGEISRLYGVMMSRTKLVVVLGGFFLLMSFEPANNERRIRIGFFSIRLVVSTASSRIRNRRITNTVSLALKLWRSHKGV